MIAGAPNRKLDEQAMIEEYLIFCSNITFLLYVLLLPILFFQFISSNHESKMMIYLR